jgi:hypothetical protein
VPLAPPAPPVADPPPALASAPDEPAALASLDAPPSPDAPPSFDAPPVRVPPDAVDPALPPEPARPLRPPLDDEALPEPPFSAAPVLVTPGVTFDDVVSPLQPGAIQSVAAIAQTLEASNRNVKNRRIHQAGGRVLARELL